MSRVVIAVADQVIVQELRSRLDQSDVSVEVVSIAESTQEMVSAILAHRPAMAFVHDQLGPGPVMQQVREGRLSWGRDAARTHQQRGARDQDEQQRGRDDNRAALKTARKHVELRRPAVPDPFSFSWKRRVRVGART